MNKLFSFVKEFTKKNLPELDSVRKKGKQYFYVNEEQKKIAEQIKKSSKLEPFSIGMPFGEMTKNGFRPSFPLLELLAKHTERIVVVNKKAETLFLYKNNIFDESIIEKPQQDGLVIVKNQTNEVIGYADMKTNKEGKKILNHRLDLSDYLKREN